MTEAYTSELSTRPRPAGPVQEARHICSGPYRPFTFPPTRTVIQDDVFTLREFQLFLGLQADVGLHAAGLRALG